MDTDFYSGIFSTHEEVDDIEALLTGKDDMEYVKISVAFLKQTALRIRQLEEDVRKYEESSM